MFIEYRPVTEYCECWLQSLLKLKLKSVVFWFGVDAENGGLFMDDGVLHKYALSTLLFPVAKKIFAKDIIYILYYLL